MGQWSVECCGTGFLLPQSLAEATEAQVLPLLLGRSVCTVPWTQQCHVRVKAPITVKLPPSPQGAEDGEAQIGKGPALTTPPGSATGTHAS